jgi:hypothetical protein
MIDLVLLLIKLQKYSLQMLFQSKFLYFFLKNQLYDHIFCRVSSCWIQIIFGFLFCHATYLPSSNFM